MFQNICFLMDGISVVYLLIPPFRWYFYYTFQQKIWWDFFFFYNVSTKNIKKWKENIFHFFLWNARKPNLAVLEEYFFQLVSSACMTSNSFTITATATITTSYWCCVKIRTLRDMYASKHSSTKYQLKFLYIFIEFTSLKSLYIVIML